MVDINNFKSLPKEIQIQILNIVQCVDWHNNYKKAYVGVNTNNELKVECFEEALKNWDEDCIISNPYMYEDFPFDEKLCDEVTALLPKQREHDYDLAESFIYPNKDEKHEEWETYNYLCEMINKIYDIRRETYSKILLDKMMKGRTNKK